ncbi:hypothetical protein RKD48_005753 [Streptomyces ambofaciens]
MVGRLETGQRRVLAQGGRVRGRVDRARPVDGHLRDTPAAVGPLVHLGRMQYGGVFDR